MNGLKKKGLNPHPKPVNIELNMKLLKAKLEKLSGNANGEMNGNPQN